MYLGMNPVINILWAVPINLCNLRCHVGREGARDGLTHAIKRTY